MVGRNDYCAMIVTWFAHWKLGGLILPEGWFGRPYDNAYRLSRVEERAGQLALNLDDGKILMEVRGLKGVRVEDKDLVIGPIESASVLWEGDERPTSRGKIECGPGEVRFVPMGSVFVYGS